MNISIRVKAYRRLHEARLRWPLTIGLALFLGFGFAAILHAQENAPSAATPGAERRVKFEHISLEQGLSQSTVRCLRQDRQGFMWFGTEDGLNKYDGYGFTIYQTDPDDPSSISHNIIRAIHEDRAGVLWIGTNGGGLNAFDRASDRFRRYQNDPDDPNSISNDYVWSIYEDVSGTLWIGTDGGGLNKLVRNQAAETPLQFVHYRHNPNQPESLSDDRVLKIIGDRSGMLWIGTRNGGLNRFDPATGRVSRFMHDPDNPNSLSNNTVRAIYQDTSGSLWIGTDGGGLDKLDFDAKGAPHFTHFRHGPRDPKSLSDDRVWDVHEVEPGRFWIATNGGGLNYFNASMQNFSRYRHNPGDPYSLSIDYIYSIYEDKTGALWFGTDVAGINKLDKYKFKFALYRNAPTDANSLSDNYTWSFYEDAAGALWIGTRAGEPEPIGQKDRGFFALS